MKGNNQLISLLNDILCNELTAINQYYMHAKMCAHWGFSKLADKAKSESIDEMHHADKLMTRILDLDGLPNLQKLGKLIVGENAMETLAADLALEQHAIPVLREAIALAENEKDFVTRDLLVTILTDEEEHAEWLETQIKLAKAIGIENYLQSQV